jgi:hypothetical protein
MIVDRHSLHMTLEIRAEDSQESVRMVKADRRPLNTSGVLVSVGPDHTQYQVISGSIIRISKVKPQNAFRSGI